jgi:hypothetical protein
MPVQLEMVTKKECDRLAGELEKCCKALKLSDKKMCYTILKEAMETTATIFLPRLNVLMQVISILDCHQLYMLFEDAAKEVKRSKKSIQF